MKRPKLIRIFKKLHKWPAIVISLFAILFATSGIVLNHRHLLSGIDVSRTLLPSNYKYTNWNLAAVRGSLPLDSSMLIYGNIGVWKCNASFRHFNDFNQGFPKGIDNRKIYSVKQINTTLFAGTHLGLYCRPINENLWKKINLPGNEERIADLALKNDTLLVLTRSYLYKSTDGLSFQKIQLPQPDNYQRKAGLFKTFWELHSGKLFGLAGKLFVDLLGIVTLLLSVTGLLHFLFPRITKRRKRKGHSAATFIQLKKTNLKWHNIPGYLFAFFLLVNTFSGMHLRPPLLIAIANKQVGIIPYTHLDTPNPWYDKLRRVHWDDYNHRYIFSTTEGFFYADEHFHEQLKAFPAQPPVSVMGCNVFESLGMNEFIVGSFSGMFVWNTLTGEVRDYFSGTPFTKPQGMTRPIGKNMATGLVYNNKTAWWFDYNRGALEVNTGLATFPEMPEHVRKASPMSLWNVALEVHTGRIFENVLGPFYILYVPLAGICMILVLISGFFLWYMAFRKQK